VTLAPRNFLTPSGGQQFLDPPGAVVGATVGTVTTAWRPIPPWVDPAFTVNATLNSGTGGLIYTIEDSPDQSIAAVVATVTLAATGVYVVVANRALSAYYRVKYQVLTDGNWSFSSYEAGKRRVA